MKQTKPTGMWKFLPPRERAKLIAMAITLIFLVATMAAALQFSRSKRPAAAPADKSAISTSDTGELSEPAGKDLGPEVSKSRKPEDDFDLYDPEILKEIEDNITYVPEEGLVLLLHNLQGKKQADIVAGTNTNVSVESLFNEPAKHRGELVYVDGIVTGLERVGIGANSIGISTIYRGFVRRSTTGTRNIRVYLLDGPLGMKNDDTVKVHGYFLHLLKRRQDGREETLPVIVARRFDPPAWLSDPASLEFAEEGGFLKENKPIYYAMHKLMSMTSAQVTKAVDPTITAKDLGEKPLQVRGKFVSFMGTIADLAKVKDPNPTGLSEYYSGYLVDKAHQPCCFYLVEPPVNMKENDLVRIDGMFIKNFAFVNRKSIETQAPIIVGRVLLPVQVDTGSMSMLILGICGLVFVVIAVAAALEIKALRKQGEHAREKVFKSAPGNLSSIARSAVKKARENDLR